MEKNSQGLQGVEEKTDPTIKRKCPITLDEVEDSDDDDEDKENVDPYYCMGLNDAAQTSKFNC